MRCRDERSHLFGRAHAGTSLFRLTDQGGTKGQREGLRDRPAWVITRHRQERSCAWDLDGTWIPGPHPSQ